MKNMFLASGQFLSHVGGNASGGEGVFSEGAIVSFPDFTDSLFLPVSRAFSLLLLRGALR